MSFNSFRDNYPAGFSGWEGEEENNYLFGVTGEVSVTAYSEEGAEIELKNNVKELLYEAYLNGDIEIN